MSSNTTLPSAKVIYVDTRGALILDEESPEVCVLSKISVPVVIAWSHVMCALDKRQQGYLPPKSY